MSGLNEFVEVDDSTEYHLFNIEYTEEFGKSVVHLFCRDKDNQKHHIEVEGHRPSFYISEDAYSKRVKNHDWVVDAERGYESIHGKPLIRIFAQLPKHIGGDDNRKGLRDHFEKTYEADVFYNSRFLIDSGIKTHFSVPDDSHKSASKGEFRVEYSDIEPVDADWRATPRMITIDIEVLSPDGFPEPQSAEQPVTAITAHDNHTDEYSVWVLRCDSWNLSDTEVKNKAVESRPNHKRIDAVEVYEDETRMLDDFNNYVSDMRPDLLSGWNSSASDMGQGFDYPYLIHRCQKCNVSSYIDWSPLEQVWDGSWGPTAKGVGFFDMLKGYKKTQWSKPKGGYGLENIAQKECHYGKEDIDDIDKAWKNDVGTFLKYNIRDVSAVLDINESAEVLDLFQNIRKLTGVQFENVHNPIDMLDPYIIRIANERNMALPTNETPERSWFYGGHVFTPKFGRHENAVYPDVWSEYPNGIRTCNISPETAVGTKEDLEDSQYTEDDCVWSYVDTRKDAIKKEDSPEYEKYYYVKPEIERGFMPEVVDMLMGLKDDYSGTELYGPVKIVVNAVWGVLGDADSYGKGYRLFDWRLGESVTLFGRKMIQYSAEEYVNNLNVLKDEYGHDGQNAYQVGGDTDSVMSSVPYVDATDRSGQQKVVNIAQEACEMVNDSYDEFASETFNATGDYMELEIESYSPYLFVPEPKTASAEGKKRYAQITAWEEGEWYDEPEFSATGIDIVRSDRAEVTRDVAEDVIDTILRTDDRSKVREKVYERLNTVVTDIKNGNVEKARLARPKGMGQPPEEYGSLSNTPQPTYRGAKYANQHFEWENMDEGSKPALLYIDKVRGDYPRTYTADTREGGKKVDAVALEEPNKLPEAFTIDYDKMVEKVVEDPLNPILAAMGWSVDEALADSSQGELSRFM